ncbi:MAG: phage tail assembly protein [Merismopedia sp. SIO2A8]|nr:phage tail assembly protein [Merismopedia sp. SIO2A8]
MFQTEFEFVLPRGLLADDGQMLHRQGRMRLATARDELWVQKHPRVRQEPEYSPLVMLSQVITQLGSMTTIQPEELEPLFSQDLAYLREFFNRINQNGDIGIAAICPQCNHGFQVELTLAGES